MSLSDISSHFTETTLDDIIRKVGGTKHTSFKFGKGFKKGDAYISKVFRLCVYGVNEENGSTQEINLIVKSMPDSLGHRKLFRTKVFFRNEINFYNYIVPAWEAFQEKQKAKNPFREYPICYATYCDGENDFIVLGDVSFSGFGAPNWQDSTTLEECIITMRTMGRFHGVSLALKSLDPDTFERIRKHLEETYFAEQYRTWYVDFQKLAIIVAQDALAKAYPGTKYEEVAKNFLNNNLYDDLIQMVSAKSKYMVFDHGDCWTPNFLTKYNENGAPEAITIIDFQLARCASLALDISFFIYSCTSQELRELHYEALLKEYHKSATDLIDDLGADASVVLPWEGLLEELRSFGRFGIGMGIEALPMSLIEDDEVAELSEIKLDAVLTDVWDIKPFEDPKKAQRIADIFKHATDEGYIK